MKEKVNYIYDYDCSARIFFRSDVPMNRTKSIVRWFSENVNNILPDYMDIYIIKKGRNYVIASDGSSFYEITFFKTKCRFNHVGIMREIEKPTDRTNRVLI